MSETQKTNVSVHPFMTQTTRLFFIVQLFCSFFAAAALSQDVGFFGSANLDLLNVFVIFPSPLNTPRAYFLTLKKTSPGRRRVAKDVVVGHLSMWDLTSVGWYVDVAAARVL